MREILFRVWDKNLKIMANVNMIKFNGDNLYPQVFYRYIDPQTGRAIDESSTFGPPDNGGNVIKLMQYSGVKDCEGNKIFEGDIVRLIDNDDYTDCYIVKYFGDKGYPAFDIDGWDNSECNGLSECTACFKLQIIGNIHDNPELVEVEK